MWGGGGGGGGGGWEEGAGEGDIKGRKSKERKSKQRVDQRSNRRKFRRTNEIFCCKATSYPTILILPNIFFTLIKSLNKTEIPIFGSVVCFLFPKTIIFDVYYKK